ncbi:MAG: histone deacetylase family protein [Pseudomonadota bacterium]
MQTFFSPVHAQRNANSELYGGTFVTPFERPERVDMILAELERRGLPSPCAVMASDLAPIRAVHDPDYVTFMETVWDRWTQTGLPGEAVPSILPGRCMRTDVVPRDVEAQLGYYAFATETSISAGTFQAAVASANVAVAACDHVLAGATGAFALCRPPGHHAARDQFGGYCFFNNAAVAAEHAREQGAERVTILDVDFHHGNGTQQIFYERPDVQVINLHGDPHQAFPHFLGYADEVGSGPGAGTTLNLPLPRGTDWPAWHSAFARAAEQIELFGPDVLIVSLGVDTFEGDPISFFKFTSPDFTTLGTVIAGLATPTVFCMEGGYAVGEIGVNTVNVLDAFATATGVIADR